MSLAVQPILRVELPTGAATLLLCPSMVVRAARRLELDACHHSQARRNPPQEGDK
ncbi:MAG TPA: hypothetical protein VJN18_04995 [Polyangiaceae bacterium]|nr:hypothetical protein [Polyangiaceae bacterium]